MNVALKDTELPVLLRFARPISDEELVRFCVENEAVRVERSADGELLVMSPVGFEGGGTENDVAVELTLWARQDGRGRTLAANTGFRLPDGSLRLADAAWVSWRRVNALSLQERKGFPPICPEFVIEVRSETDRLAAVREKMELWIANGAELAWLIDPERRVVEVYRPGEQPEVHENPTSVQGMGPVRGFELMMERVWG